MYAPVEKSKENKSRAATNSVTQKPSGGVCTFQFEVHQHKAIQKNANNSSREHPLKALQETANISPFTTALKMKSAISNSSVTQLRAKNPFEQGGEHKGYELTAHHIIPHSKLELAISLLKNYDNASKDDLGNLLNVGQVNTYTGEKLEESVLKNAVPDILTKEILVNIGIFKAEQKPHIDDAWLTKIQTALAGGQVDADTLTSPTDTSVKLNIEKHAINGISLNNLRECFYEWQGGNQFMGPSTDFREEPGSKDEVDFDAQWITDMSAADFEALTGVKQSDHRGIATPKLSDLDKSGDKALGIKLIEILGSKSKTDTPSKSEACNIKALLDKILAITKNVTPEGFKKEKWQEVSDIDEFEKLESNTTLGGSNSRTWNRKGKGVTEHAFFAFEGSKLSGLPEITKSSGSSSNAAYAYQGTDIPGSVLKMGALGQFVYIPVKGSKDIYKTPVLKKGSVLQALLDVGMLDKGDKIEINDRSDKLAFLPASNGNRKFNIVGYSEANIFIGEQVGKFDIPKSKLGKIITENYTGGLGDSLYKYCKDHADIKTSTYLPKLLYDWLKS